ncbi:MULTISPECIES: NRDE family protein [unclassified Acinetobacter]|uniref:NRDE family protein n=1 Tax=unclassified Acinetobacter TaxID=196816 RepID=UPI002934666F|nr:MULTISPECIES: NRDE family protein [unclassified Acinetobacter]WOE30526.1 NRDE family protein [Acinetobacter sp. SAAs470]WOE38717.1 NRDE family protein [Acinetobacter sp. SAAs474]
MCIVAIAWQLLDDLPLCLLSNRDEFYARPTQQLGFWHNSPVIAGQDLTSGGTWMGVTLTGRWAVITNFRDGHERAHYSTSRGHLVQKFLESTLTPIRFAQQLEKVQCDYAGFNLVLGDQQQAVYMSNRGEAPQILAPGVYVLSNTLMSQYWQKTQHLRHRFTQEFLPMLQYADTNLIDLQRLAWDLLQDQRQVVPDLLPDTGIDAAMEALLSSTFIQSADYGTRCSNLIKMTSSSWQWSEKSQQGLTQSDIVQLYGKIIS